MTLLTHIALLLLNYFRYFIGAAGALLFMYHTIAGASQISNDNIKKGAVTRKNQDIKQQRREWHAARIKADKDIQIKRKFLPILTALNNNQTVRKASYYLKLITLEQTSQAKQQIGVQYNSLTILTLIETDQENTFLAMRNSINSLINIIQSPSQLTTISSDEFIKNLLTAEKLTKHFVQLANTQEIKKNIPQAPTKETEREYAVTFTKNIISDTTLLENNIINTLNNFVILGKFLESTYKQHVNELRDFFRKHP